MSLDLWDNPLVEDDLRLDIARGEIKRLRAELDALKSKSILVQLVKEKVSSMTTAEFAQFMEAKAALYAHPVQSVPERLVPDGKYGQQHHYVEGWNDCIDAMLAAKEKS